MPDEIVVPLSAYGDVTITTAKLRGDVAADAPVTATTFRYEAPGLEGAVFEGIAEPCGERLIQVHRVDFGPYILTCNRLLGHPGDHMAIEGSTSHVDWPRDPDDE